PLDNGALEIARVAVEIPPRQPVLRPDGAGLGVEDGSQAGGDGGKAVRLERHQHDLRLREHLQVVGRCDRDREITHRRQHPDAVALHGPEMRAPRDQGDVNTGPRHFSPYEGADGAGTEDADLHWDVPGEAPSISATRRRWGFPVAVRGRSAT